MKKIRRIIVICIIGAIMFQSLWVTSFSFERSTEDKAVPSGMAYKDIQTTIEKYVEEHSKTMAGMSVAIYDENNTIYRNDFGYANKENICKVDKQTVFEWGSTSKLFIWVSAMQLVEQEKLKLNKDIRNYLPDGFLTNLTYDKKITMLDLMNHQAGFQEMYAGVQTSNENEVQHLEDTLSVHQPKQIYEPGTVTAYSNWGAALAAYIIQRVSGMDYAEYVHQNILQPLGMKHTAVSATLQDNLWVKKQREKLGCYDIDGNKIAGKGMYYITLYPAGSATGTIDDLLLFASAITPNSKRKCPLFKNQKTLSLMYTATSYYGNSGVPNNYHGFFASQYGVETLGHGGNTFGCSTMLQFDPQSGIGMVVMTNQAHEQTYNYKMYEFIFGKFADSELAQREREVPKGLVVSARTVEKGPFSVFGSLGLLSYSEEDLDSWWYQEGKCIYGGYGDYFIATEKLILNLVSILFFALAGIYGVITLIGGGLICLPIQKAMKKKKGIDIITDPFRKWNYVTSGIIAAIFIDFLVMIMRLGKGTISGEIGTISSYVMQSGAIAIMSILLIVCLVLGFVHWIKKSIDTTKTGKIKYCITVFMAICMLVNIVIFDMYQFWAI